MGKPSKELPMQTKTVQLSQVIKDIAAGPFGSKLKVSCFVDKGFPIIDGANLKGFQVTDNITKFVTEEKARSLHRSIAKRNDVIVTISGTLGQIAYIPDNSKYKEYLCSQRQFRVTFDTTQVYVPYLVFYFHTYEGQHKILSFASQVGVPALAQPLKNFRQIIVDLPSLDVQKKIAHVIEAINAKIEVNERINDNLQQQAASIFAEWLNTCTDFSTIGDMAHNILDYSPVASEQIRLLNSSDVTEGVFPVVPLVPNKDLKGHFKKRFQFGDILYSEIRPRNHHYGLVLFDASDYIASTRLMVIRAIEKKVSPVMLYQYLLLPEIEAEFTLKTESRSGTFPQGNYADMASIQVPYSPTNSQTAVSEILSRIRFAIAQNQFESQRLAELRDTLLPKLMSGEIDVSAVQL